jgi:hypothetical protein
MMPILDGPLSCVCLIKKNIFKLNKISETSKKSKVS